MINELFTLKRSAVFAKTIEWSSVSKYWYNFWANSKSNQACCLLPRWQICRV